jgi:hypothetical protein
LNRYTAIIREGNMDEHSLNRLEMAALSRRLKALRQRSGTDEIFYRLCPQVLDRIENDQWALLSFLAAVYTTREMQDEERLAGMKKSLRDDDNEMEDDDWDEEDDHDWYDGEEDPQS